MVERTTTLVDVTRNEPCPGRREELLSLAALREQSPTQAGARRHVASCRRCAAFLASLQLELRLGADAFSELRARHATRTAPPFDLTRSKTFTAWLEGELEERSELELARALTRAASWLHRLDPEVADRLVIDREDSPRAPVAMRQAIEAQIIDGLLQQLRRPDIDVRRGASSREGTQTTSASLLIDALARHFRTAGSSRADRHELAIALFDLAADLSVRLNGVVWLNRALFEWFDGDAAKVPALFERAEKTADNPHVRSASLLNLGMYHFDSQMEGPAFDLASRALLKCSPIVERSVHTNRLLWYGALGNELAMDQQLTILQRIGQLTHARSRLSPTRISAAIESLSTRYDTPPPRARATARRLIEALHGE